METWANTAHTTAAVGVAVMPVFPGLCWSCVRRDRRTCLWLTLEPSTPKTVSLRVSPATQGESLPGACASASQVPPGYVDLDRPGDCLPPATPQSAPSWRGRSSPCPSLSGSGPRHRPRGDPLTPWGVRPSSRDGLAGGGAYGASLPRSASGPPDTALGA